MLKATIQGLKNLERLGNAVKSEEKSVDKALNSGIKVEGYRLTRLLIREIRAGAPGGRPLKPLTNLAKYKASKGVFKNTGRKPFTRLFGTRRAGDAGSQGLSRGTLPVRYDSREDHQGFHLHFGFVDTKKEPLSDSWKQLMTMHQKGFQSKASPRMKQWIAKTGGAIWEDSPRRARPFFLRRTTNVFRTPARPIIDPFWKAHQSEAWLNIRDNFRKKMRGERI